MNVLFLISAKPYFTNAVREYDAAFGRYSRHLIHYFDATQHPVDFDLAGFDAILFSFSFFSFTRDLPASLLSKLKAFHGPKIGIFQDEYDYFLRHRNNIRFMGLDTIVTCAPEESWPQVFSGDFSQIPLIHALAGYVPEDLLQLPPPKPFVERKWHIGYRGRPVPYLYGKMTREKYTIGVRMQELCLENAISANIDVTEEGRVYGSAWPELIRNCRVMLGTESGCNVFDFDGTVIPALQAYLEKHPETPFEKAHDLFLKSIDGHVRLAAISPKMFEAIALGTGLVLFEGEYSGVLTPWEHYIPLKKNYSNIQEVFAAVQDIQLLEKMTEKATKDIIQSGRYSYAQYIKKIDDRLEQLQPAPQNLTPVYTLAGWQQRDGTLGYLPEQLCMFPLQGIPMHSADAPFACFTVSYVLKRYWVGKKQKIWAFFKKCRLLSLLYGRILKTRNYY